MPRASDLLPLAIVAAAAAAFVWIWHQGQVGLPAFDIYMYYHPNMVYAAQRLSDGGGGLLWNPWQNCGQPSFGISSTGLLYPVNAFYLLLAPGTALRLVAVVNFLIAGVGAFALGRELGLGRTAALCTALSFQLGSANIDLNTWGPQMGAGFVWLPVAMLCCERLLRAPSFAAAVGLGASLALALLPGFPQVVLYAYQLIALRVLYELLTRRAAWSPVGLGLIGLGLALAPLLTAVHLLPGVESAVASVRGGSLTDREMQPGAAFTWQVLRDQIAARALIFNPVVVIPTAAAAAWWCRRATRRIGAFYFLAGIVYLLLAVGEQTPLFDLYRRLPFGALFREPGRFTWMVSFSLAVLTGLGVDALLSPDGRRWRAVAPAACAVALFGLGMLTPRGLLTSERVLGVLLVAGGLLASVAPRWRGVGGTAAAAAVALGLLLFFPYFSPAPAVGAPPRPRPEWGLALRGGPLRRLIDDRDLQREAGALRALATHLTPQDRAYFVYRHGDFSFMLKSASLYGLASVQDYEPQAGRRYAEYYTRLRSGQRLRSLNQFYFPMLGPQTITRPLLDLSAARYVIIADDGRPPGEFGHPQIRPVDVSDDLRLTLYENPAALPRARWVPRAEVVTDPAALLDRLALGRDDPRAVLLLEAAPPSGFLGAPADRPADPGVEFAVDRPEHVALRVRAPAPGFLHLADQYAPGWTATVNGAPAPILRADYLFRAVEVPAGASLVEFRYRPISLLLGGAVSGATAAALLGVAVWRRRRRAGA